LEEEGNIGSFDFAYVDADKPGYIKYYEILLKLLRPNGVIVFDNMWYGKKVTDENPTHPNAKALKELGLFLQKDERVDINMLDIADGITIVRKR
jgi:predicted O-methyltransferase YrrM